MEGPVDDADPTSIFKSGFRWPVAGDSPFVTSERWQNNASIDPFGHGRLGMMVLGYKIAADLMVGHVATTRYDGDALIYPIIFNYRQFVELSLKHLISSYGPSVGIAPVWNTHDLAKLWRKFLAVLESYGHSDDEGTDAIVGEIILEFFRVDPGSFAFRYPVDQQGQHIELSPQEVDLANLAEVMRGLEGYFNGCDGFLDSVRSAAGDC